MTKEEFLTEFKDVLQTDVDLKPETALDDLDEWDSLSMMSTVAFMDRQFGVKLTTKDFRAFETVGDILAKAGLT